MVWTTPDRDRGNAISGVEVTFKLGLTGSIGMGKSTTADLFVELGCALWDADKAVHRLYEKGGAAVAEIGAVFPSVVQNDCVSRDVLRELIQEDPSVLPRIEKIVHPLVAADRADFLNRTTHDITVLDIPLLFETGGDKEMDAVACVSTTDQEQERRVLARGKMTADQFHQIRHKQMPNVEKCARADFVIVTDTLEHARQQVQTITDQIRQGLADA